MGIAPSLNYSALIEPKSPSPVNANAHYCAYQSMELRPTDEHEFLAALGRRVRHVRALRGMSRKVLARVSGISERYLAQLESGNGNVSIKLLRRAAAAMGTRIEDLVADAAPP